MARAGSDASIPVLCIGNFVAGGAGKTPTAITIARHLQAKGERPVFVSRGYHANIATLCEVDVNRHSAADVGDEALLLARVAPTIIGADRAASAKRAEALGASLIILDDGLQNPSLHHDFRLAVVDGASGIGNGLCLPAGPLRAPFLAQLAHVVAVSFIGAGESTAELVEIISRSGKPVLKAKLIADKVIGDQLALQKVVAFAGIGLPRKFRTTLEDLGSEITGWHSFPDHHIYSLRALRGLQAEAGRMRAQLVTTEKDFVRLAPLLHRLDRNLPMPVPLPVELVFDDKNRLDDLLRQAIIDARTRIDTRR
jgi:tetraacyldisaccharide 4'-kinase